MRNKPLARKKPKGAPNCGHIAADARLPSSAVSEASSAAPDHSPPKPKPWQKRMSANSAGAMMHAVAEVAKDHRSQRPSHERQTKGRKRLQQCYRRVLSGREEE